MVKSVPPIVRYFLVAGFLVPCVLMFVIALGHVKVGGKWVWAIIIPWPSFPFIMSAEAGGGAFGEFVAFMQSAAVNVLIYGLVGITISFGYRKLFSRTQ
jgi:hypothetical protein